MAQKGIREFDAKHLLAKYLPRFSSAQYDGRVALVGPATDLDQLKSEYPWLSEGKLVVKPDQLFGKRGKNQLLLLDANIETALDWIKQRMAKKVMVGSVEGELTHFLIEPFIPHDHEYYLAIRSGRPGDTIYFSETGGVDIEENWDRVRQIEVPVLASIDRFDLSSLFEQAEFHDKEIVLDFIKGLYQFYRELHFAYLEINPFTVSAGKVVPLDTVARLDDTAAFECQDYWGGIEFPVSFGKKQTREETYISELDEKSGSSMKLTILNPEGRIWLMVAGGGASVIYTDTVVDLGYMNELANYGEYSGNPTKDETKEYAKTILDLMTRNKHPQGKILVIGGGIANFTDVAKTFTGIIEALTEYREQLIENKIRIFVRRGGPNYQEGLENMRALGNSLGVPIEVYGPETHMTRIVPSAIETLNLDGRK